MQVFIVSSLNFVAEEGEFFVARLSTGNYYPVQDQWIRVFTFLGDITDRHIKKVEFLGITDNLEIEVRIWLY